MRAFHRSPSAAQAERQTVNLNDERRTANAHSVLSPKYEVFCCDQNGPPARREEGAYLNRYVTDEQRSRRSIFIATLWAGASWLFFPVARSTRITQIWALRSRLEKQPTDLRQNTSYFGDRTLGRFRFAPRRYGECRWRRAAHEMRQMSRHRAKL